MEWGGFEPPKGKNPADLQSAALDHYATTPYIIKFYFLGANNVITENTPPV